MDLETLFHRESDAADALREGWYKWHRRDHVPVPVRIWFGPPFDPDTGEELDRSWRWQVLVNGQTLEAYAASRHREPAEQLERIWPRCAGTGGPSAEDRKEYDFLIATIEHARQHDGFSPFASRTGRVDLLSATIPQPGD